MQDKLSQQDIGVEFLDTLFHGPERMAAGVPTCDGVNK